MNRADWEQNSLFSSWLFKAQDGYSGYYIASNVNFLQELL